MEIARTHEPVGAVGEARPDLDRADRRARLAGALYLVTFATSIPALVLKAPALAAVTDAGGGAGVAGALVAAVVLEVLLAVACVGTGVTLLLVLGPGEAARGVGFLASRLVEAGLVMVGACAMLALADPAVAAGAGAPVLVGLHDAAFLLGPGLLAAVNALLLAPAAVRARLVPRPLGLLGLVGAPLLLASTGASLLGLLPQVSQLAGLAALPIAAWELGLGLWLLVRGGSSSSAHRPLTRPGARRRRGAAASSS